MAKQCDYWLQVARSQNQPPNALRRRGAPFQTKAGSNKPLTVEPDRVTL